MFIRLNRAKDHEFLIYFMNNCNIIELLQVLEIIPTTKCCGDCNKAMVIKECDRYNIGCAWKCSKCKVMISLTDYCVLKGTNISPFVFLKFAFYFYNKNNFTAQYVMKNCGREEKMYARILSLVRKKKSAYVLANRR
ncbi:hypothetical protein DMUE_2370 [Dictyocoela muelleri]|nr:hypothetical protein DMUE_2370 [Dictyocoela muelleri]